MAEETSRRSIKVLDLSSPNWRWMTILSFNPLYDHRKTRRHINPTIRRFTSEDGCHIGASMEREREMK
jgi:hypothetical protein